MPRFRAILLEDMWSEADLKRAAGTKWVNRVGIGKTGIPEITSERQK